MFTTKQKIAVAHLVQVFVLGVRRLFGKGPHTRVWRSDAQWEIDLREGIDFSIWLLGSFEPDTVRCYKRLIKEGDVVLDIGANIGAHSLILAQAVGCTGKVYSFEPTDYAYAKLTNNCSLNPDLSNRIHCMQYMLVDKAGAEKPPTHIYASWPLKKSKELHELHQGKLMPVSGAQARTLDDIVDFIGLRRVDCIKLDIDGFECGMMRGATKVLSMWRPIIVMELAPYALQEQGEGLHVLIELLRGYGYGLYDLSGSALVMNPSALEKQIPTGASLNVVARHLLQATT